MEKIIDIIDSIAHEKGLPPESAKEAFKTALVQTAKRVICETCDYDAEIDEVNKTYILRQKITVVEADDPRLVDEPEKYIALEEAREIDPDAEIDDELTGEPINLEKYGRSAAAALYHEIEYHIQRFVEEQMFNKYKAMIGTIVSGPVTRVDSEENTYIEIDEVRAVLPKRNRIKGESFRVGETIKGILRYVGIDKKFGIHLEISRTMPKFLEELLRQEVPEIADGLVIIEKSARIPGERAKVALTATSPSVDPVGATVGVRGVRINAVSQELHGENIDCIEYSPIPEIFVARALSPAIISSVKIEGEKAVVTLPSDQKSKAIGRSGINIRLASMLTGYQIELAEIASTATCTTTEGGIEEEKPLNPDALKALFGE
ncbi:transcription termination factor NusA [Hydrogenimonas urashimensis]|uniref:transcription termination factor NusA n=1 Tax=Hydrogenimonas urashimensis TaxID=2740515 RepID=UPI00191593EE|nr:transcription termination factor NusA [Hydrogenimonas urashimensis]